MINFLAISTMFENIQPTTPMPSDKINLLISWIVQNEALSVDAAAIAFQLNLTPIDASKFLSKLPDDCFTFNTPGALTATLTGMFFMRYWGIGRIETMVDDLIASGSPVNFFVDSSAIKQALLDTWVLHGVAAIASDYFILSPRIYNLIEAVK